MKKLLVAVSCAFLLGGLGVSSATADTFDWTLTGVDYGSGTITATPTAVSGEYLITGMTGTITGYLFGTATIEGVVPQYTWPSPTDPADSNDNLLYYPASIASTAPPYQTANSYLDINGVSFYLNSVGTCTNAPTDPCFNLYYGSDYTPTPANTGYNLLYPNDTGNDLLTDFTVTPASVTPEPGSFVLLGTGAAGMIGMIRRKLNRA